MRIKDIKLILEEERNIILNSRSKTQVSEAFEDGKLAEIEFILSLL